MKTIFTIYNNAIDKRLFHYQSMVVDKFRGDIEFLSIYHEYPNDKINHGDVLGIWINRLFNTTNCDCLLILDIDCIPLTQKSIETTFELAYNGNLVGNIQRTNHIQNNQHVFVAPSFLGLSKQTYKNLGRPTFSDSEDGDVAEQLTYNAENLGIPCIYYMPKHSELFPEGNSWALADGMPHYGIGTTFEFQGMDMSYHLFESRLGKWNQMFYNKCHQLITS